MNWVVRPADRADVAWLVALGRGDIDAWGHEQFAAEFGLPISKIYVVVGPAPDAPHGPPVPLGCVVRWVIVDEVQVLNVVVHPVARRRGVGQALMRTVLDEAKELGLCQIVLEVRQDNVAAIKLYEALRFVATGVRQSYYVRSGSDAVLMTLNVRSGGSH